MATKTAVSSGSGNVGYLDPSTVALCRLEQIAPFPYERIVSVVERYPNAEVVWAQEEPQNMGCWGYVKPVSRVKGA